MSGAQDFIPSADSLKSFQISEGLREKCQDRLVEYMKSQGRVFSKENQSTNVWVKRRLEAPRLISFKSNLPKFPNREFRELFTETINRELKRYKSVLEKYERLEAEVGNAKNEGTLILDMKEIQNGILLYQDTRRDIPDDH